MKTVLLLIVLLPFAGFIINGLGRNYFSKRYISFNACGQILASFVFSIVAFMAVKENGGETVKYFDFINVGSLRIPFEFKIDQLSAIFLLIITGVGFLIHVYSAAYMHHEKTEHYGRYFSYLN